MCVCASFRDKHEMKTRFSRAHPLCASRFPLLPLVSDFDSDSGATSPSLNTDMDGQQQAYGVQRSLSLFFSHSLAVGSATSMSTTQSLPLATSQPVSQSANAVAIHMENIRLSVWNISSSTEAQTGQRCGPAQCLPSVCAHVTN